MRDTYSSISVGKDPFHDLVDWDGSYIVEAEKGVISENGPESHGLGSFLRHNLKDSCRLVPMDNLDLLSNENLSVDIHVNMNDGRMWSLRVKHDCRQVINFEAVR